MYQSNLSYSLLEKYLSALLDKGLLTRDLEKNDLIKTTEKGNKFLQDYYAYRELSSLAREAKESLDHPSEPPQKLEKSSQLSRKSLSNNRIAVITLASDSLDAACKDELEMSIQRSLRKSKWIVQAVNIIDPDSLSES